ncbi:hypothetical protein CGC48_03350 [Capnocytophaga cynodegmi]|uniref:Uncharacterized protein n=1 Tax=Capnocytophaga cynodegmi TaxID=28189 RepID=A0A250E8T7_9FLAO|nr:hypothetical protein [Capnocytophaga cynodegmi]ATA69261.1 hypothetical protein CGC48_03350 [Capnocytophaga cynodegmi]
MEHFLSGIMYFPKGMNNIPNGTRHFPKGITYFPKEMDNIPNGTRHFLVEAKDISPVHCIEQCDVRCFLSNIDIN